MTRIDIRPVLFSVLCAVALTACEKSTTAVATPIATGVAQEAALPLMQTRAELYEFLDYHAYERKLDALFGQSQD